MQNPESSIVFDRERASSYDQRTAKIAPLRDALHLLIRIVLSELPANARILCVGAGTGSELIYLAQTFPQWQFTALEPAAPMLDICRQRAAEIGIASRCTFHEGYLDSLPPSQSFDAATCLLVSHFIMQPQDRRNFFSQIASRLRPNGYLVSSDVVSDMSTSAYQSLLEVWLRMLRYAEIPTEEVEKFRASYGRDVAVLPPFEVESIIASSGFNTPVLFFQSLLIHAWYAKKIPDILANEYR
ncbi:class I SAM-dependent methyltransferase [Microcoleus sp. herbarium19]|uniref:class I SAM-dependent methyltransferase n=1 Tax=unclassified Microcoleus TaxID=2642155 RepID=UPI002FD23B07